MNQLDQLKQHTIVVADTGDFESMRAYTPRDATTNPSLILKAVQQAAYRPLLDRVLSQNRHLPLDAIVDRLLIGGQRMFGPQRRRAAVGDDGGQRRPGQSRLLRGGAAGRADCTQ